LARPRTITQRAVVPAAPAAVYDAFVNARTHAAFTGARATGSGRVGGAFTAWDGYISGVNRQLSPGKKIVQDWRTTEWPEGAPDSQVEFTFKAVKGGTEVRMVHSNVPAEQAASYRQGWVDFYWKPLQAYFGRSGRTAG
jgi:activator of HSP90 ATPase